MQRRLGGGSDLKEAALAAADASRRIGVTVIEGELGTEEGSG
jgi:hypothetical protein